MFRVHPAFALVSLLLACLGVAPVRAADPEGTFFEAYYLEIEEAKLEAALALYEEVLRTPELTPALRQRTEARLAVLREEIRSRRLAALMPPGLLAYVEIDSPGEQLESLLRWGGPDAAGEDARSALPIDLSPRLLAALKEVAGVAIALTELDPRRGQPRGVAVINAGRSDLVHGLVETLLSAAALEPELHSVLAPAEPIHGHRTYEGPFGCLVVTERLIVAATARELARDVVGRLHGEALPALSDDPRFVELRTRRPDSLLFAYADAERMVALAREMMSRNGRLPQEYAILQAVADIESLRSASASLSVADDGVRGEVWLRLAEENRSLVYNLLRTPRITEGALSAAPADIVALVGLGLGGEGLARGLAAAQPFTGLDIGREVFANLTDAILFVGQGSAPGPDPRVPLPELGLLLRTNDPAASERIWGGLLEVPVTLLAAEPRPVRTETIAGSVVTVYAFPGPVTLYQSALGDRLVVTTTQEAMAAVLEASRGEAATVLADAELGPALRAADRNPSKLVAIHLGRAFGLFRRYGRVPPQEAQVLDSLLGGATLGLSTDESPSALGLHLRLDRLNLAGVLDALIEHAGGSRVSRRGPAPAPAAGGD